MKKYVIQGKARWAKIIGAPSPGFENGPPEWTFDLVLDEANKGKLLESGVDKFYLKTDKEGQEFVKFVRKAEKKDGTTSQPIEVVDHRNTPWDTRLIGNDSVLNVCYSVNTVKSQGKSRNKPYVLSVQVWDYAKYTPKSAFDVKTEELTETSQEQWA